MKQKTQKKLITQETDDSSDDIFNKFRIPNYDDIRDMFNKIDMISEADQRFYLGEVFEKADKERRKVIAKKSSASRKFKKGLISADKSRLEINSYIKKLRSSTNNYFKNKFLASLALICGD